MPLLEGRGFRGRASICVCERERARAEDRAPDELREKGRTSARRAERRTTFSASASPPLFILYGPSLSGMREEWELRGRVQISQETPKASKGGVTYVRAECRATDDIERERQPAPPRWCSRALSLYHTRARPFVSIRCPLQISYAFSSGVLYSDIDVRPRGGQSDGPR